MRSPAAVLSYILIAAGALDAQEVEISWDGDLATLDWKEPLADPAAASDEVPFSVLTGPFVGWLTDTRATIGWEVIAEKRLTDKPYASLSGGYDLGRIQFRSAKLADLEPDTTYRYRLRSSTGKRRYVGPEYRFRTFPPRSSAKFRFAVIGDTQRSGSEPWRGINWKLFGDIRRWDPSLLLHVGDIVYDSWGNDINGRKGWYRVFRIAREVRASTFMSPGLGNHDIKQGKHLWPPGYFRDIPPVRGNAAGAAHPPFYYSFDVANIHFVALCSVVRRARKGEDLSDRRLYGRFTYNDQIAWLKEDLHGSRATWKIAFFHHPLHTVGGYPASPGLREDFGRLFDKHGVQLIVSGHDHSYQRTLRIRNATRELSDTGSVQVISGGASNLFNGRTAPWNVRHTRINHYLRVEVEGDSLRVDAVNVEGVVFDSWRLDTRGQPRTLKSLDGNYGQEE